MTDNNGKVRPFGIKDKLGYMFGDFGNDFTFLLSAMFLLKFYTDVMGVSAALVGLMMMAARFVDAITDVTMGQIVDRSRPGKKGKFAPWLRRMCGPVALASFILGLFKYKLTVESTDVGVPPPASLLAYVPSGNIYTILAFYVNI